MDELMKVTCQEWHIVSTDYCLLNKLSKRGVYGIWRKSVTVIMTISDR